MTVGCNRHADETSNIRLAGAYSNQQGTVCNQTRKVSWFGVQCPRGVVQPRRVRLLSIQGKGESP